MTAAAASPAANASRWRFSPSTRPSSPGVRSRKRVVRHADAGLRRERQSFAAAHSDHERLASRPPPRRRTARPGAAAAGRRARRPAGAVSRPDLEGVAHPVLEARHRRPRVVDVLVTARSAPRWWCWPGRCGNGPLRGDGGEYRAFVSATGGTGDDRCGTTTAFQTVILLSVSWDDARAYVSWVASQWRPWPSRPPVSSATLK